MKDDFEAMNETGTNGMGHFGKITSLKDLPSDKIMVAYLKQAMKLNEEGTIVKRKILPIDKKNLVVPDYMLKALVKK
ncbi:MAG: hypothetical protein LH629_16485 [Ignavibacteria bacterium]|nr:hypothetical protein [Ignavibacteria bacterium]